MKINNQYNFPTQLKNELVDSPASNLHCCQYLVPVYQFQTCPQAEIKIFQIFLIKYQIIYLWGVCSWSRSWVHDSLGLIREGLSVCSDSSLVYNENHIRVWQIYVDAKNQSNIFEQPKIVLTSHYALGLSVKLWLLLSQKSKSKSLKSNI